MDLGWKGCESQRRIRGFSEIVSASDIRRHAKRVSPIWRLSAEQGWHQWTWPTGWRKAHETSNPHKEQQATEEIWEEKRWSFQGKNTTVSCLVPNGQPQEHIQVAVYTLDQLHSVINRFCFVLFSFLLEKKRGHEFEWGGIYGRVWRKEMEGRIS